MLKYFKCAFLILTLSSQYNAVQVTRLQPLQQTADGLPDLQEDDDSAEEADTDAGQGDDDTIVASNEG